MSIALLCDACGNVFGEGAQGSASGTGVVFIKGENNRTVPEQKRQDTCPPCVTGAQKRAQGGRPQLSIVSGTAIDSETEEG